MKKKTSVILALIMALIAMLPGCGGVNDTVLDPKVFTALTQNLVVLEANHNSLVQSCAMYRLQTGKSPKSVAELSAYIANMQDVLGMEGATHDITGGKLITTFSSSMYASPFKLTTDISKEGQATVKEYPAEYTQKP